MTDRWLNYVLSVVVVVGLIGVVIYSQPRDREERARFLDQELAEAPDEDPPPSEDRDPIELRQRVRESTTETEAPDLDPLGLPERSTPALGAHGVSASHPLAVEVGMEVLGAGGNAVDAAVAIAYTLGVVEPFGSGLGGGGAMLVVEPDAEPWYLDYREIAPLDGEPPASDIGVPGFVAGMDHAHDRYGDIDLADLIEYAARYAEDGFEVDAYLEERLTEAAHRMPIHLLPRLFPDGAPISAGATLRQPEYAEALRLIQDQGADVVYDGELGERIVAEVSGLEMEDLRAYEVLETAPARGRFAGYDLLAGGAPVAGPAVIQTLQIAEALGIGDLDPDGTDAVHVLAQAWRQADGQRMASIADPSQEDVDLDALLDPDVSAALAERIPDDGFSELPDTDREEPSIETDTTHVVVVDDRGTMVSMTNTLSNFFGSGLPVSGFFLNDQLKNLSADPDSINHAAPGKRPRSFIAPVVVVDDEGRAILGIGSPGGRRIPNMISQVLVRWGAHGHDLAEAVDAPRFHLEDRRLEVEQDPANSQRDDLAARGYEVTSFVPTSEYYGSIQVLTVDWDEGQVSGTEDERRIGAWAAADDTEANE